MPGGSHYAKQSGWSTNPRYVYEAAKAKAHSCINDPAPKLTRLEHAFWIAAKEGR